MSFGPQKPKRAKTKVILGITREAVEADRTGGYLHSRLLEVALPRNLFGMDYYFLEHGSRAGGLVRRAPGPFARHRGSSHVERRSGRDP